MSCVDVRNEIEKLAVMRVTLFLEILTGNEGVYVGRDRIIFSSVGVDKLFSGCLFKLDNSGKLSKYVQMPRRSKRGGYINYKLA